MNLARNGAGGEDPLPWTLGEYRLFEELGEGGMGTVYKATHTKLGRTVAVKVLAARHRADQDARDRFHRELKAVGALEHPNIIRVEYAGEEADVPYLAMELIQGSDLERLVKKLGSLRVADASELIRQAAMALQYALDNKLVHRDIKPSNLVLGDDGRLRVIDWGLARSRSPDPFSDVTRPNTIMGSTRYLAPERMVTPESVDPRSDLYSLGCTLFQLLCGSPPFAQPVAEDRLANRIAQASQDAPSARLTRTDVPVTLLKVIDRLLDMDPAKRYESPRQLAEALKPLTIGHDLRSLVGADPDLFGEPTGMKVIDRVGSENRESETIPPHGNPATFGPIPIGLRILAIYLAIATVVLGGIWGWMNHGPAKDELKPIESVALPPETPPKPEPDPEPPVHFPPFRPSGQLVAEDGPRANAQLNVDLDLGRLKNVYEPGEAIRATVRANLAGSITIYQVAFTDSEGEPVSGPSMLTTVSQRLPEGQDVELVAGQARGGGVLVVLVNREDPRAGDASAIEGSVRKLAAQGRNAFLDDVEGLPWPAGSWHQVVKYATKERETKGGPDRSQLAGGSPVAFEREPRRVAFCVGASEYLDEDISNLGFAAEDAVTMAKDLARRGGYEVIGTLTGKSVTREAVEDWLFRRLPEATRSGDEVVIYWSGHGGKVPDADGDEPPGDSFDECLLLYDSRTGDHHLVAETVLLDDRLNQALRNLEGRKVALILDVCFAGGASKGGVSPDAGLAQGSGAFLSGLLDRTSRLAKGPGDPRAGDLVFLAASTDEQRTFGHLDGKLSVMTFFLNEILVRDGAVSVAGAFEYLKTQLPVYFQSRLGSDRLSLTPVLEGAAATSSSFYLSRPDQKVRGERESTRATGATK